MTKPSYEERRITKHSKSLSSTDSASRTKGESMSSETRLFPIQRGLAIPWSLAEIAYRTYAAHYYGQSLERLAERGGFGWHEFLHLYFGDADWKLTDAQVEERWNADMLQKVLSQVEKLQAFKKYVHDRLDAAGINKHEEQNAINGCRIGSRLDDALATFPRTSRNQTVSSGVEGAHEGTTADKSGEPEKLNNAHRYSTEAAKYCECSDRYMISAKKFCPRCGLGVCGYCTLGGHKDAEGKECSPPALAESSLSSPPPTWPCPNCGKPLYDSGDHGIIHVNQADQCASPELLQTQLDKKREIK